MSDTSLHGPASSDIYPGLASDIQIYIARLIYKDSYSSKYTSVFADLNVTVAGEKWTCLLGASGVGKTSLIRLIAGLVPNIDSRNSVLTREGYPLHGKISWMAQNDMLMPWANVLDNVLIGLRLQQGTADKEQKDKARDILNQLGLSGTEQQLPDSLSGGMRQRVALARTLMEERPIILMDEPFSSLDVLTRQRLQELFFAALYGRTVLLVTHDPMEALRTADHIKVMTTSTGITESFSAQTGDFMASIAPVVTRIEDMDISHMPPPLREMNNTDIMQGYAHLLEKLRDGRKE